VLTYAWVQTVGPSVTLSSLNSALATFTPVFAGTYGFRLTVSDGRLSDADVVTITAGTNAQTFNASPVAIAVAPEETLTGFRVTLNATGSYDPNPTDTISYEWTQTAGPSVVLSGATTERATFTPSEPGIYAFRLVVSDGRLSSSGDVTVAVLSGVPSAGAFRVVPNRVVLRNIASGAPRATVAGPAELAGTTVRVFTFAGDPTGETVLAAAGAGSEGEIDAGELPAPGLYFVVSREGDTIRVLVEP
jgi:hypothetical protein